MLHITLNLYLIIFSLIISFVRIWLFASSSFLLLFAACVLLFCLHREIETDQKRDFVIAEDKESEKTRGHSKHKGEKHTFCFEFCFVCSPWRCFCCPFVRMMCFVLCSVAWKSSWRRYRKRERRREKTRLVHAKKKSSKKTERPRDREARNGCVFVYRGWSIEWAEGCEVSVLQNRKNEN